MHTVFLLCFINVMLGFCFAVFDILLNSNIACFIAANRRGCPGFIVFYFCSIYLSIYPCLFLYRCYIAEMVVNLMKIRRGCSVFGYIFIVFLLLYRMQVSLLLWRLFRGPVIKVWSAKSEPKWAYA